MGSASKSSMGLLEWMLLIVLSMIWGSSYFFNRVALDDLSPLVIVFGRVAIGALVLNLVLRTRGGWLPRDRSLWGRFVVMGAMSQVIPFCLIVWSQTSISGGLAAILNATTPLFTLVAAYLLTRREPLSANRLAGVLVGIVGVVVVIGPTSILDLGGNREQLVAQLAVLTAALSYALASLYGRRFKEMNPLVPAAGQVTGSSLLLLPVVLVLDRPWTLQQPAAESVGAVLALAVLCTAVAYVLYFRILASAGASNLSLVTFLLPISALLLSTLILHEPIGVRQLAGMGVIFSGLVLVDGRLVTRARWIGRTHPARATP
jgi:drug/metabolite transporter (DMT)-like permease